MMIRKIALATVGAAALMASVARPQALAAGGTAADQAAIAALEQRIAAAVEARNAPGILANYIKGDQLLVFDAIPPREYKGSEAYLKDWQGVLDSCAASPKMEITDLSSQVAGSFAYSHSIQHFACPGKNGKPLELTMRTTDVYRKIGGKWLIVHEHNSVPADLATARADLSSKP